MHGCHTSGKSQELIFFHYQRKVRECDNLLGEIDILKIVRENWDLSGKTYCTSQSDARFKKKRKKGVLILLNAEYVWNLLWQSFVNKTLTILNTSIHYHKQYNYRNKSPHRF